MIPELSIWAQGTHQRDGVEEGREGMRQKKGSQRESRQEKDLTHSNWL